MTSPQASTSSPPKPPTSTSPSSPAQTQPQSPSAPSISLTPATRVTALHHSIPDQPQPPTEMSGTVPAPAAASTSAAKPTSSEKAPLPAASSSKATPSSGAAQASPAKAASTSTKPVGQKKKRRRKGFAGLLLSLGCLSASEFEDDPKEVKKREAAAGKSAAGTSKAEVKPTTAAPVVKEKQSEAVKPAESKTAPGKGAIGAGAAAGVVAGTAGAALGTAAEKREKEEVVAPPAEPVSPPLDETAGMTSSAVQPPGSGSELLQTTPSRPIAIRRESEAGTPSAEQTSSGGYTEMLQTEATDSQDRDEHADAEGEEEYGVEEEYEDEEDRLIAQGGVGIPLDEYGRPAPLLPPIAKEHTGRKCLVLDLDETLLHSSFKMLPSADYIVPVEIESQTHNVYVIKRPGVDKFLTEMGKIYEVVVFTASLSKYADPVLDMLDPDGVVKHRLFRESCYNHKGNYVKDLSQLGRTMETCIILDNSPASYIFHPNNAVPVSTWFNDPHDTELTDLCPFLADLATVDDIRGVLDGTL